MELQTVHILYYLFHNQSYNQLLFIEMFPISQSMRLMKSLTLEEQNRYIKFHQNPSHDDMDEMNWTSHHFMELYVDHGNSFDTLIEHFYRKIEFFLFQWIIV